MSQDQFAVLKPRLSCVDSFKCVWGRRGGHWQRYEQCNLFPGMGETGQELWRFLYDVHLCKSIIISPLSLRTYNRMPSRSSLNPIISEQASHHDSPARWINSPRLGCSPPFKYASYSPIRLPPFTHLSRYASRRCSHSRHSAGQ